MLSSELARAVCRLAVVQRVGRRRLPLLLLVYFWIVNSSRCSRSVGRLPCTPGVDLPSTALVRDRRISVRRIAVRRISVQDD